MQIETKLLSGALGAEIKGIDLTDVSDENFNKINSLLLEHKVIFFRDQPLTTDQHIALAEKFGPLETHAYVKGIKDYPEIVRIIKAEDEKNKNILSATTEVLSLYIDLNFRKVAEFEEEKLMIMDQFIKENKSKFKIDNLQFSNKLKK